MTSPTRYIPPTSESIAARQDGDEALRLLLAQRHLYSRAKRWLGSRWLGMIVIGIGAPVVAVVWPPLAVAAGAIAGLWIFLGRTVLAVRQSSLTDQAAAVQERFDLHVFGMPELAPREVTPSPEDIALAAGQDKNVRSAAKKQRLLNWYPINENDPGAVSVAIAQRANAAYSDRLLRVTTTLWISLATVWVIALVVASVVMNLALSDFMLGVFLPVLPAALDAIEFLDDVRTSARERADLANAIRAHLENGSQLPDSEELMVWQDRLYDLRRSAPLVPDAIYWLSRKRNELAMQAAAAGLSAKTHGRGGGQAEERR